MGYKAYTLLGDLMKKCNFLTRNLIAHRGYHDIKKEIPENSLQAFKRAILYNYLIEFDIHLTKDNKLVVFHDENLKRMCGIDKNISDCTYDELKKLYLLNTSSKIPLLKEVLDLVNNKVPIIIEIKGNNKYGVIEKYLVKLLDNYKGEYAVQSFNPLNILWFKLNRPNVICGIIKLFYRKKDLKQLILKTLFLRADYIAKDVKFFSKKRRTNNKLIIGWTIRTKEEYDKYKYYYDNLICENMDLYKDD